MNEDAKRNLRNAMVMALADGRLANEEKQLIESLRGKLGADAQEFASLCAEVHKDPSRISISRDVDLALATLGLLVEMAAADGQIQQVELNLLHRLAEYVGLDSEQVDRMVNQALGTDEATEKRVADAIEEMYLQFESWDDATRQAKIDALVQAGRVAVVPILRAVESYRTPDGAADGLTMKTLLTRALGRIGDPRAVYYLVQEASFGDLDDEVTNQALRFASAEAIGKIIHQPFGADQNGVQAVRQWWQTPVSRTYDRLAF